MKKLLVMSILFSLILVTPGFQTADAQFKIDGLNRINIATDSYRYRAFTPVKKDEYIKRFGEFPDRILWENLHEKNTVTWNVKYLVARRRHEDKIPWKRPLKAKDIKDHLFWEMTRLDDQTVTYLPVTINDEEEVIESDDYYEAGWQIEVEQDLWAMNFEKDVLYETTLVMMKDPCVSTIIPEQTNVKLKVIRTTQSTTIDTFLHIKNTNKLYNDPDFIAKMINEYPYCTTMLDELRSRYFWEVNPDSLKWVTSQLNYALRYKRNERILKGGMYYLFDILDKQRWSEELEVGLGRLLYIVCRDSTIPPPWHTD